VLLDFGRGDGEGLIGAEVGQRALHAPRAAPRLHYGGDAVMASAALDRVLHRATVINIKGDSDRMKEKRQTGLFPGTVAPPDPGRRSAHQVKITRPFSFVRGWVTSKRAKVGQFLASVDTLLGALAQRLPAGLANALHDRVLRFSAGVERARALLHLIK
jgi:hypothetical protein